MAKSAKKPEPAVEQVFDVAISFLVADERVASTIKSARGALDEVLASSSASRVGSSRRPALDRLRRRRAAVEKSGHLPTSTKAQLKT